MQILKLALITGLHLLSACVSFLFFHSGCTSRTTIPLLMTSCTRAGHQFSVPWLSAGIDMIVAVDQYQYMHLIIYCVSVACIVLVCFEILKTKRNICQYDWMEGAFQSAV